MYCTGSFRHNRHGYASIAPHSKIPLTCRLRSAQGGLFDVSRSRMAFGSAISWLFFVQISSKIVNFVFLSKMLNFAISFVFRPKRISCVPSNQQQLTQSGNSKSIVPVTVWTEHRTSTSQCIIIYKIHNK